MTFLSNIDFVKQIWVNWVRQRKNLTRLARNTRLYLFYLQKERHESSVARRGPAVNHTVLTQIIQAVSTLHGRTSKKLTSYRIHAFNIQVLNSYQ